MGAVISLSNDLKRFLGDVFASETWLEGLETRREADRLRVAFASEELKKIFLAREQNAFESACRGFFRNPSLPIVYEPGDGPDKPGETKSGGESDIDALFGSFETTEKTELILAAAKKALEPDDGSNSSVLVICGESGEGKSLLLDLVHSALRIRWPRDKFLKDAALNHRAMEISGGPYKTLLLDNLRDLTDRPDGQNFLADRLDAMRSVREKLAYVLIAAFTGRREELGDFQPRLRCRLEAGLILETAPPDLEARLKYIEKRARSLGLSKEQILYAARNTARFTQLAGLVGKLEFFKSVRGRLPGAAEMERLLESAALSRPTDAAAIIKRAAKLFGLKPWEIMAESRKPAPLLARQLAMYVCRRELGLSYQEVGRVFGGRDHSTVIHAVKKIARLKDTDINARKLLAELTDSPP